MAPPLTWKKRLVFAVLAILPALLLLEGLSSLLWFAADYRRFMRSLPIATQFKEEHHSRHDTGLGWVNIPGKRLRDFYGPGRHITINADGFRGLEDYGGAKPADRFRVVCLGDSFTLGYGVDDADTFPAQLEALNPAVQSVNMGQGGYSVGQCYLWYQRDGTALQADCLVFAFVLDDIWRMTGGRMINGAAMPDFAIEDGRLVVRGQPVPGKIQTGRPVVDGGQKLRFLAEHSSLVRSVAAAVGQLKHEASANLREEQMRVTLAILDAVRATARQQQIPLVIVLLPEYRELLDARQGQLYRAVSTVIGEFAAKQDLPLLDLYDTFAEGGPTGVGGLYLEEQWHHFSEAGNKWVAEELDRFLAKTVPGYPRTE